MIGPTGSSTSVEVMRWCGIIRYAGGSHDELISSAPSYSSPEPELCMYQLSIIIYGVRTP